jgi:hypothetical protein
LHQTEEDVESIAKQIEKEAASGEYQSDEDEEDQQQ